MPELQETPTKIGLKAILDPATDATRLSSSLFLDHLIMRSFFTNGELEKTAIYRALGDKVKRPDCKIVKIAQDQADDEISAIVQTIDQMQREYGTVYIKHEEGHSGFGLMKFTSTDKTLTFKFPQSSSMREVGLKLMRLIDSKDGIIFYENSGQNRDEIEIPLERVGFQQSRAEALTALVKHGFREGEYAIEKAIKIPLIEGKTWEIRAIMQCPKGIPEITTHWGKVGRDKDFSNFGLGGEAQTPESIVTSVFSAHSNDSASVADKVQDYLKRSDEVALTAASVLVEYMQDLSEARIEGFDPKKFYPREFAVDITGEFDENGILQPVLGEIQYPMNPWYSYIPQLEKVDPEGLKKIRETAESITKEDVGLLTSLA